MPQPQILLGSYTSDGNARLIEAPFASVGANVRIELYNRDNFDSDDDPGVVKRAWWQSGQPDGSWRGVKNTDALLTDETTGAATNGFTLVDTNQTLQLEAPVTGTAITAATPAVATAAAHGYNVGDVVRIVGTTGMLQIAGYDFTVTAVGGVNNFTLGYLPAVGFAAPATALTARRLRYEDIYTPRKRLISNITAAASAVVTLSVTHGYQVGQKVRFIVPEEYGMVEMNNLVGQVTAINTTTNTITVDIDSSGFTAFAFPTSAQAAAGVNFAHIVPAGEDSLLVSAPTQNVGFSGINVGTDIVGADTEVVDYKIIFGY